MAHFPQTGAALLSLVVVAGPAVLGLLAGLYICRPSPYFLATAIALTAAILGCDGWIIAHRHWIAGGLALPAQIACLIFLDGYAASPLPAPAPLSDLLPSASPPAGMALFALPTGMNRRTAAFAYRGGSPWEKRDFVLAAVLVRHPKGDVVIDTGLGKTIVSQLRQAPCLFRLGTNLERSRTAADQLDAAGYDRKHLRYILLTHAHWDRVSGAPDFPGVPVLVTVAERQFIGEGGWATTTAQGVNAAAFQEYTFDGGAYLGFTHSRDLYDDGSIVIVPAPGHTPGSVIVFVTLPGDARFAFIGDLVWRFEGFLERNPLPWFEAKTIGEDPVAFRQTLLQVSAIATRYPQITIVPAHDPRGYAGIPEWSRSTLR